ncbi:hypothetical protein AGMMS49938_09900 [Fibrobacterales bacterium]|nr:hypothetical protein AGMMS49938_09900 [Fibrobacterales bacterium]
MKYIVLCFLFLTSCATFHAVKPDGFAEYTDNTKTEFRAISPDGMLYRVTEYEQESQATAEFWRGAFLLKMKNANYKVEDTLNIQVGGKPSIGYLFSYAGNVEESLYMVVAVPLKKKVIVAEATGTAEQWQIRKSDVVKAVSEIDLN